MLELRLLLVGLFDRLGALLLRLWGFRGRAVRGVALRDGSGCVSRRLSARAVCRGGGVCVWAGASGAAVVWQRATAGRFVCQRAGGLRRRAPCVLRAVASACAAFRSVFVV